MDILPIYVLDIVLGAFQRLVCNKSVRLGIDLHMEKLEVK